MSTSTQSIGARNRSALWAVGFGYGLLVLIKLALAWDLNAPLKPDELVYLGNARYLATGSGLTDDAGRHAYKVGYSLVLSPAFLLSQDPVDGFKAAQVVNAFLLSLVFPAAYLLAGRLWSGLASGDHLRIALCVSMYPAALLYSTTAMSANVFLPGYFALLLAAHEALSRPRWWSWALFGCCTLCLYAVHERAIGIVLVAAAVAVLYLLRSGSGRLPALGFVVASAGTYGLLRWVEVPGSRWRTGSQTMEVLQGVARDPEKVLVTLSGHLEYLGFSTFTVLFVGIVLGGATARQASSRWRAPGLFWLMLAGATVSVVSISVLFNVVRWPEERFTQWVYGRHSETVLLPVVVVTLLALRQAESPEHRRKYLAAWGIATTGLAVLAAVLYWAWTPDVGPAFHFCATSVALYSKLVHVGGWAAAPMILLGWSILGALFAWRWRWGVTALTLGFAVSSAVTYTDGWRHRYEETEAQRELVHLIRRIETEQEPKNRVLLRHKSGKIFHFHYFNASYFLPEYTFYTYRPDRKSQRGELVLSNRLDFPTIHPGARMVGLENLPADIGYRQLLWVLPGALQDRLAEKRWLLPRSFPRRLSRKYLRSGLQISADQPPPQDLRRGQEAVLPLELTHRGLGPWPHARGMGSSDHSIAVAVQWTRRNEPDKPLASDLVPLPRVVYPGETIEVSLPLRGRVALEPDIYRVRIAVVQLLHGRPVVEGNSLELSINLGR